MLRASRDGRVARVVSLHGVGSNGALVTNGRRRRVHGGGSGRGRGDGGLGYNAVFTSVASWGRLSSRTRMLH